jgi:hypothetical protein
VGNLSFFQTYRLLTSHRKLAEQRDKNFGANRKAKLMAFIFVAFAAIYLLFLSVCFAMIAIETHDFTSTHLIVMALPFILVTDFALRAALQQTPSQIVRPYTVLPLPRRRCIDCLVIRQLMSGFNWFWLFFFVPYIFMSVLFSFGLWTSLLLLLFLHLAILLNGQIASLINTLGTRHILWWLLVIPVYVPMFLPLITDNSSGYIRLYRPLGEWLELGNPLPFLVLFMVFVLVTKVNREMQQRSIWAELNKTERTRLHPALTLNFLKKNGLVGTFIQLEINSLTRNKNPRKSMLSAIAICVLVSLITIFSNVYDDTLFSNYWCLYCFTIFSGMILSRGLSYEANFINALMVRHESLLQLLLAKYYFYCSCLLLPFLLLLPLVITGKWNLLMLVAYAAFTAGFQNYILLQNVTISQSKVPLNEKFISKGGVETNYINIVILFACLILPLFLFHVINTLFSEMTAYLIILTIGLIFMASHRWWISRLYHRWMRRRYVLLAKFNQ